MERVESPEIGILEANNFITSAFLWQVSAMEWAHNMFKEDKYVVSY